MPITYSTYEAKARFSEVLRQVREGETVTVTYRGEPVAEIHPIHREQDSAETHLDELERRGALVRATEPWRPPAPVEPIPGALDRFLADRNE